ncbi:hypothetical protein AGQ46_24635 [Salmonella enterica subsp. enterica]|nr:hypothetical protein AGQ46_24635 [Salmonella enterica subsp. enterica]
MCVIGHQHAHQEYKVQVLFVGASGSEIRHVKAAANPQAAVADASGKPRRIANGENDKGSGQRQPHDEQMVNAKEPDDAKRHDEISLSGHLA